MTTWLNISVREGSSSASDVNDCYTFHEGDSKWSEARDACRDMGAHLVTMETTAEWNKVKALIAEKVKESTYTHYYVGLRKEGGKWKWTEGETPSLIVAETDSRWQKNEPSGYRYESCGEVWYPTTGLKGLNNVFCDHKFKAAGSTTPRGYICENY